jgi:protein-tyrosine phosphatase
MKKYVASILLLQGCVTATEAPKPIVTPYTPREEMVSEQTKGIPSIETSITNFHEVEIGFYRSGRLTPENIALLSSKYHLKTIVSLETYMLASQVKRDEMQAAQKYGVKYLNFPIMPVGDLDVSKLNYIIPALKNEQRPILIHCYRGSERVGTSVAAYRMLVNGWSFANATKEMDDYGFSPLFKEWKRDMKKWVEKQK